MRKHQYVTERQVTLECPCCERLFESHSSNLKIGSAILCPKCRSLFLCRSKDLFDALKGINQMVS